MTISANDILGVVDETTNGQYAYYLTDLDEEVVNSARMYFQWGESFYHRHPGTPDPYADGMG